MNNIAQFFHLASYTIPVNEVAIINVSNGNERGTNHMSQLNQEMGNIIYELRKSKGITQEDLANQLGISYQAVSKWENGISCPDIALIPKLAFIFGTTIDALFGKSEIQNSLHDALELEILFQGDVKDTSGNDYHGQLIGGQYCKDRFGRENSAIYLNGKSDYIILEQPPALSAQGFTISVWCYYDTKTSFDGWHSAIISQDGQQSNRCLQLSTKDDNITLHRFLKEPDIYLPAKISTESWYHIVISYENNTYYAYLNGKLITQSEGDFTPSVSEPLYIGRKSTNESYFFFHGKIDDLRLYNRVITPTEVEALHLENGWKPHILPTTTPSAYPLPILDKLDTVRMVLPTSCFSEAALWYQNVLGFRTHVDEKHFKMLALEKGPLLVLDQHNEIVETHHSHAPFIFKTRLQIIDLEHYLSSSGATNIHIEDEGFANFIHFDDPFGQKWILIREK